MPALTDIFSTPLVSGSRRGDSPIQSVPYRASHRTVSYVKDAQGHEHAPAGSPEGGRFTSLNQGSGLVDDFVSKTRSSRVGGPKREREEDAAKQMGFGSANEYHDHVYKMLKDSVDPAWGNALREEFFGEDYGRPIYEKLARGDYTGTAGLVWEMANSDLPEPMDLTRYDWRIPDNLTPGATFNFDTPAAFTAHQSPGVFNGTKVVIHGATKGTRVSALSYYPEGEVFSYDPRGYVVRDVTEENGRLTYHVVPNRKSEVQDQYGRPLDPTLYAHAPKGGVTIKSKFFKGGEFIPAEVLVDASPEERAAVESGSSRQKPLPPEGGVKEPKPVEKGVDFSRLDKIGKKELSKMVSSGRLIEDFEKEFAAAPIEHMLITIPERKGVFPSPASAIHIAGERDRVEIPQMKNLTSATVTHNHPDGANLSLRDLEAMLRTGIKELRAVTPDGTVYSLGVEHSTGYVPEDVIRQVVHEAAKLYADEEDSRKSIKDQAEVYDKIWSHLASKPIQTRVNGYDRSIKFFYKKSGESRGRPLPPEGGVREPKQSKPSIRLGLLDANGDRTYIPPPALAREGTTAFDSALSVLRKSGIDPNEVGGTMVLFSDSASQQLAYACGDGVTLNLTEKNKADLEKIWVETEKAVQEGTVPTFVMSSLTDVLVHELAHNIARRWTPKEYAEWERVFEQNRDVDELPSFYAQENSSEMWAECVTALLTGKPFGGTAKEYKPSAGVIRQATASLLSRFQK